MFVTTFWKIRMLFTSSRLPTQEELDKVALGAYFIQIIVLYSHLLASASSVPPLLLVLPPFFFFFIIIWLHRAASCHSMHTSSLFFLFSCIMAQLFWGSLLSRVWSFTKMGIEWRWSSNYLGAKENQAFEKDPERNE